MQESSTVSARKKAQAIYDKACALTKGELILHENQGRKPPNFWIRFKLRRATKLFREVLELAPDNWASMWLLGKTVQRLGDEKTAFEWFVKAWDQKPKNVDVAREASLSAMNLGLARHAVEYCEEALRLDPQDAGLLCNLALAMLHDGKSAEAFTLAQQAIDRNPSDAVCKSVMKLAQHFVRTKASCPRNSAELDAYCRKHRDIFR